MHQTWMKMRMTNHLCGQHQGKELAEERRDPATDDEDLLPLVPPRVPPSCTREEKKRTSSMARSNCFPETRGVKGLASEQRIPRFCIVQAEARGLYDVTTNARASGTLHARCARHVDLAGPWPFWLKSRCFCPEHDVKLLFVVCLC